DSVILTTSSLELWMLSEASRLLLKLKSTDEYCYILFSAFNKFAEEPIFFNFFTEFGLFKLFVEFCLVSIYSVS
ncbi:MAG: hypothetical protein MR983_08690, partial [Succinatimonas sp.]|nr:hypothetical protein [Succinatimonas sp.]